MPGNKKASWKGLTRRMARHHSKPSPPEAQASADTASVEEVFETTPSLKAEKPASISAASISAPTLAINDDITDNPDEKYGLQPLHATVTTNDDDDRDDDGKESTNAVDIIAVHGITGDAYNTWTHENGTMWLRDLIPKEFPGVRVFSFGYPASVFFTRDKRGLEDFARSLLNDLRGKRRKKQYKKRPIIFICHSMGGIVVKKALIITKIDDVRYENIRTSVKGIMFLATPHRGSSEMKFPKVLAEIATVATNLSGTARFVGSQRSDLIEALEKDSNILLDISTDFRNQTKDIKIASFIEQVLTPPAKSLIVDKNSAMMGISTETIHPMAGCDHTNICRFSGKSSGAYNTILTKFLDWVDEFDQQCDDEPTAEDQKFLQSLSFPEMIYRRKDIEQASSGTCEWILKHESYESWIESEGQLLWIRGSPGTGKSTLMAFVYQSLQSKHFQGITSGITLEFFFHGRGTELQKTPIGMFRSLLHQLYLKVRCVRSRLQKVFKEKSVLGEAATDWKWHFKELRELFTDSLLFALKSKAIIIFVDALDEAGSDIASELADYFHDLNDKFTDRNLAGKICISCRHYPILAADTSLHVCVEDENEHDIKRYVEVTIKNKLRRDIKASILLPPDKMQVLEQTIVEEARGIFMWICLSIPLIIRRIKEGESVMKILVEIDKVPTGVLRRISSVATMAPLSTQHVPRGL